VILISDISQTLKEFNFKKLYLTLKELSTLIINFNFKELNETLQRTLRFFSSNCIEVRKTVLRLCTKTAICTLISHLQKALKSLRTMKTQNRERRARKGR